MGPLVYDRYRGPYHMYGIGASSVDVEYSALVCNHHYSPVCMHLL